MPLLRFISPVVLTFTLSAALPAQAALRAAPSTRATSEVTLTYPEGQAPADAKPLVIRVDYGQPHLRGRALHTDSLVPYDKPWRVGANAATRFTTDAELVLGGATITKGTYVLFAVPSRTAWKLIVQKNGPRPEVTYDAANTIATIDLRSQTVVAEQESLTISLIPATGPGATRGELRISWGSFAVSADWTVK